MPIIARAEVYEHRAALELLYRRMPRDIRSFVVNDVLREMTLGRLDGTGLWVARLEDKVVGALWSMALSPGVASLTPPEVPVMWNRDALAGHLVTTALEDLQRRGFSVAQCLLEEQAPAESARDLTRGGLPHITDLVILDRDTSPPPPDLIDATVPPIAWRSYAPTLEDEFRTVLQTTYETSWDMPELEGARNFDDILQAHRAQSRFDPQRWRIGVIPDPGSCVPSRAIMLLSDLPGQDTWEVAYLGLTPPARRRRIGRRALADALTLARPFVPRLLISVDARNTPAVKLYETVGFLPRERRAVHLALLKSWTKPAGSIR